MEEQDRLRREAVASTAEAQAIIDGKGTIEMVDFISERVFRARLIRDQARGYRFAPVLRTPGVTLLPRAQAPRQRFREPRPRRTARTTGSRGDPSEPDPDLAHRHDREVTAAVWRYERARSGHGYKFEAPPGALA